MKLTEAIKEHALRLGFSQVGVTTPELLPHAQVFDAWLSQGRHGEMSYLASPRSRARRAYPKSSLPECRSVIVLGWSYPIPVLVDSYDDRGSIIHGRIASYALVEDYHDVVIRHLHGLVNYIETYLGHEVAHREYTDTGPILERELAQRAGLGWIGKNTCLINPSCGSYFTLAEILLGIELEPDDPFVHNRCGTCQRCIQACPTGCILADRTLDARRCISYLTIELRGSIPVDLRPLMDHWVFGCDICQQVCPWNRFAIEQNEAIEDPILLNPTPNLVEELGLTAPDFNHAYQHSPLRRAKRRGYLRNVAVALGNSHNSQAVPALSRTLIDDLEPLVRAHAAWALGQIGGAHARQALNKASTCEADAMVKEEIQSALVGC